MSSLNVKIFFSLFLTFSFSLPLFSMGFDEGKKLSKRSAIAPPHAAVALHHKKNEFYTKHDKDALTKFTKSAVFASHKLGDVKLLHSKDGFTVRKDKINHKVKPYNIDKALRGLDKKQLEVLQKHGYIEVKKLSNGEYTLKSNIRGLGGGPITAGVLQWSAKALCYGSIGAAAASATVATGGAAAAALGGGAAVTATTAAVVTGASTLAAETALGAAMVATGPGMVAAAIGTSTAATATATLATSGAIAASGGCMATMVAGVEAVGWGAWALGMWLPIP